MKNKLPMITITIDPARLDRYFVVLADDRNTAMFYISERKDMFKWIEKQLEIIESLFPMREFPKT